MENQSFAYSNPTPSDQTSGSVVAPNPTPTASLGEPAKKTPLGLVIGLVIAIVFAVAFLVLFVLFLMKYNEASSDVENQINSAVAIAVKEKSDAKDLECMEREKSPYETFAGPADYGELSFEYPKTWSVYIAKDAVDGGDFEAYLNPSEVNPVSDTTVNALRVSILSKSFDKAIADYSSLVNKGQLTLKVVTINGQNANRYEGTFSSGLKGTAIVMKIRDKTAIIQTDAELFVKDYNKLVETIKFNI